MPRSNITKLYALPDGLLLALTRRPHPQTRILQNRIFIGRIGEPAQNIVVPDAQTYRDQFGARFTSEMGELYVPHIYNTKEEPTWKGDKLRPCQDQVDDYNVNDPFTTPKIMPHS